MDEKNHFLGDNAIRNYDEDLFNFKHYAEKIKTLIQKNSSNKEPLTIGIFGKWGEGKTSFLNLLKFKIEHFEKKEGEKEYLVYEFNPWRYSSEDEMLYDFFDGLRKQFYIKDKTKLQEAGEILQKYSKYLKAVKISATVGLPKILNSKIEFTPDKILEALGEDLKGEDITIERLKEKVNKAISEAHFKIIVVIDDIDRLDKNEIYAILKLIKLNASFENFIFIATLDSEHVAKAIKDRYGSDIEDGNLFLEKIINIPIHLPKVERSDLQLFFERKLKQASANLTLNEKKESEIQQIIYDFDSHLFDSPREIIRVLNGFFIGGFGFEDEINLTDLFWIEYLKLKDEEIYKKIKKYNGHIGNNAVFNGQSIVIDFNDDLIAEDKGFFGEKTNGTRTEFIEKHIKSIYIIDKLFPNNINKRTDAIVFEENLNINSVHHFDKYFSFHTIGKIKNASVSKILKLINEKDEIELKFEIEKLFTETETSYKVIYKIENIVKSFRTDSSKIEDRNFFYSFILQNLGIIPLEEVDMFGLDNRIRFVELIATILNESNQNDSEKEISLQIAKKLDIYKLCHFVRKFNDEKATFKNDLENLVSQEAIQLFNEDNPIYQNISNPNKMIMSIWKDYENKSFNEHIGKSLTDIERVKRLIRNFTGFWNNSYYGGFIARNYDYMKSLVDVDLVFSKIEEFDSSLVLKIDIDNYPLIDEVVAYSEDENMEHFIYWYKKEQKKKMLLLIKK